MKASTHEQEALYRRPVQRSYEQDLTHNFSTVGKVASTVIIKDRYSNQSKGFGFVEMETEEEARLAIERFNGGKLVAGVNGSPWEGERVTPVNTMLPAVRRSCVVVLIGPGLATGDAAKAFLLNVDLVVSATDAARLGELVGAALALKRHMVAAVDTAAAARLGG